MLKSMTGYGKSSHTFDGTTIEIEVRAVNSRYLDVNVKMPRMYLFAEDGLKKAVGGKAARGKIDVFVSIDTETADQVDISINEPLANAYMTALKSLADVGLRDDLSIMQMAKLPDVLTVTRRDLDTEAFLENLFLVTNEALQQLDAMRQAEGAALRADIEKHLAQIQQISGRIEEKSPQTVVEYREKLVLRMTELLENAQIEESRILTEAALFADKVAIDEEIARLDSHAEQLKTMLSSGGSVGRKLDFLLQEFSREANTIGSKCQNLEIGSLVIELKAHMEKIREQVQNIE